MHKKDSQNHIKGVKTCKKHFKMVKMHDFYTLGVHISGFGANSATATATTVTFRSSAYTIVSYI